LRIGKEAPRLERLRREEVVKRYRELAPRARRLTDWFLACEERIGTDIREFRIAEVSLPQCNDLRHRRVVHGAIVHHNADVSRERRPCADRRVSAGDTAV
jgi:hypothetical protein